MILVVSLCKEKLHEAEFVRPVEDILKKNEIPFFTKHYLEVGVGDLEKAEKVIICGTSLADDSYLGKLDSFSWVKDFDKPFFGICAGFQVIGLLFGGKKKKNLEIGLFEEEFSREFFGLEGNCEVYHLHNNYVLFSDYFGSFTTGEIVQAVKHKEKEIYGTLFHPEVRQKNIILEFCKK